MNKFEFEVHNNHNGFFSIHLCVAHPDRTLVHGYKNIHKPEEIAIFLNIPIHKYNKIISKYRAKKDVLDGTVFYRQKDANAFLKNLEPYIIIKKLIF